MRENVQSFTGTISIFCSQQHISQVKSYTTVSGPAVLSSMVSPLAKEHIAKVEGGSIVLLLLFFCLSLHFGLSTRLLHSSLLLHLHCDPPLQFVLVFSIGGWPLLYRLNVYEI
jgi:hypothetical protein